MSNNNFDPEQLLRLKQFGVHGQATNKEYSARIEQELERRQRALQEVQKKVNNLRQQQAETVSGFGGAGELMAASSYRRMLAQDLNALLAREQELKQGVDRALILQGLAIEEEIS